jgi:hypothetical protein
MSASVGQIRKTIRALKQTNITLYKQKYNFYKLYYGMGIGHGLFWSVAGYTGYMMVEKHLDPKEKELLWIGGSTVGLFSLGCILLIHRRARYSVAELIQFGESIQIISNQLLGRKSFHIPLNAVNLVEPRSKIMVANSFVDIMRFHFRSVYKLETPIGTFFMNPDGITNLAALRKAISK